jgi:dTDP-4-dehydrorhamnose 3,5-epimerase
VIFTPTLVDGAYLIEPESHQDHRGTFTRIFCQREFGQSGLAVDVAQCSLSFNSKKGTLRGMHFQVVPSEEVKVVRCVRGSIYDVVLDLRPGSPTYLRHHAARLTADNRLALYIPAGCAHGFQSLEDDSEILYQMNAFYAPEHSHGVRWNDPAFGIAWPLPDPIMIERDASYPDFAPIRET